MWNMVNRKFRFHDGKHGAALAVRVVPRAKKDEIVAILADGSLKIRLKAPPVEGKANRALVKFLAKKIGVPVRDIEIVAGQTSRSKLVSILDMDPDQIQERLLGFLP